MSEEHAGPEIVTVCGSIRPGNYTQMALRLVEDELSHQGVTVTSLDPSEMTLPFPGQDIETEDPQTLKDAVSRATGVVMATPEYHGTFSAILKLVIENLGFPSVLAGKPVALLGVAAGRIGAIKSLEQLRGVCSHTGAIVLPGPISIAGVRGVFDDWGNCTDEPTEKAVRSVASNLMGYIEQNICPRIALEQIVRGDAA